MSKRYDVLIVDDNKHVRDILKGGLVRKGQQDGIDLHTHEAEDGEEGWSRIERGGIDLVILDFYMPNVDGGSLLERVRDSETHRALPVLVVSSEPDRKRVALDGGADEFLDKPLRLADVADTVRSLLNIPA